MRTLLFFTLLLGFYQPLLAVDASIDHAVFKSPETPYVEVYIHVSGRSVQFQYDADSLRQAAVEVLILFRKDSAIVKADRFTLQSPRGKLPMDFIDLKRYAMIEGAYDLQVELSDVARPEQKISYQKKFSIDFPEEEVQLSDVQLLADCRKASNTTVFTKNGYDLEPLPYFFYGRQHKALIFYAELYHLDAKVEQPATVTYSIERASNQERSTVSIGHRKVLPAAINPLLVPIDIRELESGNFYLQVIVRDQDGNLLASTSKFFQRSNPLPQASPEAIARRDLDQEFVARLSAEELERALLALTPKMPSADVESVDVMLKEENLNAQRMYLFAYYSQRQPSDPEQAYQSYMEVVHAVEKQFQSGFRHGFETDRGYIFLKYGAPDDIVEQTEEPSAPPYEVWFYNEFPATGQNNVRFIFYNPTLAPGEFELLHSTAIGERSDPQWQRRLYRNAPEEIDGDLLGNGMQDNFGRNAMRIFNNNN